MKKTKTKNKLDHTCSLGESREHSVSQSSEKSIQEERKPQHP